MRTRSARELLAMASKKLIGQIRGRVPVREIVDAYAEGVLDGIQAERRRQNAQPEPYDPGTAWHRQIAPNGKTLESLLEAPAYIPLVSGRT